MGKRGEKIKKSLKLSVRERRAILLLLPLIAVLIWMLWSASRPRFDDSATILGDTLGGHENTAPGKPAARGLPDNVLHEESHALFHFDPNTVTYEELRRLGLEKNTAAGIIKYRERGKVFQIPEDFATCYGVTDSTYAVLKPYIVIAEEYRPRPLRADMDNSGGGRNDVNTAGRPAGRVTGQTTAALPEPGTFDPNVLDADGFTAWGFSGRQAEVIINFREARGGFRSAQDFAECYVVSPEMFERLKEHIVIGVPEKATPARVDINSADSTLLVSIRGIGPRSAADIIGYRERLGGFHDIAQLAEVKSVTEKNYELIKEQIWADSCKIQKIDINFATPNTVGDHPYMTGKRLRKILSNRQLRGGWSTIEDMIEDNTLTSEEAAMLAPYLQFTAQPR